MLEIKKYNPLRIRIPIQMYCIGLTVSLSCLFVVIKLACIPARKKEAIAVNIAIKIILVFLL
jgi:hypothetical protein